MKSSSGLVTIFLLFACGVSFGNACRSLVIPRAVNSALRKHFGGWNIVTPNLLSSREDREEWNQNYGNECPGVIKGRFTGTGEGYALSLVRGSGKTLEQQIVAFLPSTAGLKTVVVDPPSHVDVVTVLRKFGPGLYTSREDELSLSIKFDTIGVSEIDAGTVVYYWTGKKFDSLVTSE